MTYYLDSFIKLFIVWVCCLVLGAVSLFAALAEDDFFILAILFGVAFVVIAYIMFYILCRDIIERKGYNSGEIPLLPIVIAAGPLAMVYTAGLPDKNAQIPEVKPDDSWVCTCGGRNSNQTNICKKCGRTTDGK